MIPFPHVPARPIRADGSAKRLPRFVTAAACVVATLVYADPGRPQPSVAARRAAEPPLVDGVLGDKAWQDAFRATDFTLLGESRSAGQPTVAMAVYTDEIRDFPHPRSAEGLRAAARRWGAVVGLQAAEAFELIRAIQA